MKPIACYKCNELITFKENILSDKTGKKIPLDPSTLEAHKCENANFISQVLECRHCNEEIIFDNEHVSPRGKKIPLDPETLQAHQSEEGMKAWRNNSKGTINCRLCNEAIYFSDSNMSESGKYIPIEVLSQKLHACPKRPFIRK